MSAQDEKEKPVRERIERLRARLERAQSRGDHVGLIPVLKGILDLLEDEL